jgi:hypothetical protein
MKGKKRRTCLNLVVDLFSILRVARSWNYQVPIIKLESVRLPVDDQELTWSGFSTAFRPPIGVHFSPFSRVACASIRRAFDTVGVVHQPLEVFDKRPFVVAESGFFLEGARAEIVAAIHNQIRALAELKK